MVYPPSEDTFLLLDAVKRENLCGKSFLEIGCGSGLISVEAAKLGAEVTAVDLCPDAVEATKRRAKLEGVNVNAFVSDMFRNVSSGFDIIAFNPPYLPCDHGPDCDPAWCGGPDGMTHIRRFLTDVGNYLNKNGKFFLLFSSLNKPEEILGWDGFEMTLVRTKKIFMETLFVVMGKCL